MLDLEPLNSLEYHADLLIRGAFNKIPLVCEGCYYPNGWIYIKCDDKHNKSSKYHTSNRQAYFSTKDSDTYECRHDSGIRKPVAYNILHGDTPKSKYFYQIFVPELTIKLINLWIKYQSEPLPKIPFLERKNVII